MNKVEVDMVINLILSLIKILEGANPNVAKNPIVIELEKVIASIQALGI